MLFDLGTRFEFTGQPFLKYSCMRCKICNNKSYIPAEVPDISPTLMTRCGGPSDWLARK